VAFSLDCHDREAMAYVATTGAITGELVRDLMAETLLSDSLRLSTGRLFPPLLG
jgi:hypothetical protein